MDASTLSHVPIFLPRESILYNAALVLASFVLMEAAHAAFRTYVFRREEARRRRRRRMGRDKLDDHVMNGNGAVKTEDSAAGPAPSPPEEPTRNQLDKTACQFAHLSVNCTLAALGVYQWFVVFARAAGDEGQEHNSYVPPPDFNKRFAGYVHLTYFGCLMVSYNAWSSYVGWMLWGGEPRLMTAHHIFASMVGSISAFTYCGWRYYAPYFYGVIELSSLPLSVLNAFNVRPDWRRSMPVFQAAVQAAFVVSFLVVRVGLWLRNIAPFLADTWTIVSSPALPTAVRGMTFVGSVVPAVFLTCLQLFWVTVIVKGVRDIIAGTADDMQEGKKGA